LVISLAVIAGRGPQELFKVIVLPPGTENKPALMAGFGLIVVGIAAGYWRVLMARSATPPASGPG
jgi:hypothetical protein